jgi:hypothetical protein
MTEHDQFHDDYVSKAYDGGVEAGRKFRDAVTDYWYKNPVQRHDDKIVIHAFANLVGLSQAYQSAGMALFASKMRQFFMGFCQSHPLTNFSDAGQQELASDSKFKGMHSFCSCRKVKLIRW